MPGLEQIADWCSGARRGMSPVILALLAAWLLLFVLHLGAFAWPGRVAIFLAIFAAVRWLLRRLFDFGRTGFLGGRRYRGGR